MPDHVVVTGVAGFIGSHLAERLLAQGCRVTGVDSFSDFYDPRIKRDNLAGIAEDGAFRLVEGSLADVDLDPILDDATAVFHLAAQAGVRTSWGTEFEVYIDSNIRTTQRLCEALRGRGIGSFVYASSSSVYGETDRLPMQEDHPTRPVSPYGVTKLAGENLCLLYARAYALPVVCLRYFTVYGPRQRPDMAFHRFIRASLQGEPVEVYGNGSQTRDFTYVDDIVDANLAALGYRGDARVFNVGGGSRVSLSRVLDLVGEATGRGVDVRYVDRQRGDVTHTSADITLARRELGYEPRVALEDGIAREVEWVGRLLSRPREDS